MIGSFVKLTRSGGGMTNILVQNWLGNLLPVSETKPRTKPKPQPWLLDLPLVICSDYGMQTYIVLRESCAPAVAPYHLYTPHFAWGGSFMARKTELFSGFHERPIIFLGTL